MIAVLLAYLPLLLLTLAVECPLVAAVAPRGMKRQAVTVCIAVNLLTHPTATLFYWRGIQDVVSLELIVCFCEWLVYARLLRLHVVRALPIAVLANLCSAVLGFLLWGFTQM